LKAFSSQFTAFSQDLMLEISQLLPQLNSSNQFSMS